MTTFSIPTKEPGKDYNPTQSQHQLNNQPAKAGNAPPDTPAQTHPKKPDSKATTQSLTRGKNSPTANNPTSERPNILYTPTKTPAEPTKTRNTQPRTTEKTEKQCTEPPPPKRTSRLHLPPSARRDDPTTRKRKRHHALSEYGKQAKALLNQKTHKSMRNMEQS